MVEVSQSTLFFSVSLCVLIFTGFLVWIMYYLAQIMKQSNEMITEIREKMAELEEAIMAIKDKVSSSANSIAFVASEMKNIVQFIQDRKAPKRTRRKTSK